MADHSLESSQIRVAKLKQEINLTNHKEHRQSSEPIKNLKQTRVRHQAREESARASETKAILNFSENH